MLHFQHHKVSKQQSNTGVYRVPDSVRFDQDQITDVPVPVLVHLWLDHTVTTVDVTMRTGCCMFVIYFVDINLQHLVFNRHMFIMKAG